MKTFLQVITCVIIAIISYGLGIWSNNNKEPEIIEKIIEVPVIEATTPEQIKTKINSLIKKHDELYPRKLDYISIVDLVNSKKIRWVFEEKEESSISYDY